MLRCSCAQSKLPEIPGTMCGILVSGAIRNARLNRTLDLTRTTRGRYRAQIAESYKKKIESIVRKPTKTEDEEPVSPCPYCAAASPATTLDCPGCKNRVPYCIVSGLRMVADDWSNCPSCRFPALHSRFVAHLEADSRCPMCENEVAPASVHLIRDPTENLNKAARMLSRGDAHESGS
jgi:WD repeat-containing protein 19